MRASTPPPRAPGLPAVPASRRLLLLLLLLPGLSALTACRGSGEAGKFKHTGHVTIAKGSCTACHGTDPAVPGSPSASACTACHAKGAQLFAELRALPKAGRIVPQRPSTYSDVRFSHAPHAGAGIACGDCHVLPAGGKQESSYPKMADCKGCHEKNGVAAACPTCHRERR